MGYGGMGYGGSMYGGYGGYNRMGMHGQQQNQGE